MAPRVKAKTEAKPPPKKRVRDPRPDDVPESPTAPAEPAKKVKPVLIHEPDPVVEIPALVIPDPDQFVEVAKWEEAIIENATGDDDLSIPLETMAAELRKTSGQVYATAKRLGCSHNTVYRYLDRFPELRQIRSLYRGLMVDMAETKLAQNVLAGDQRAIEYVLDRQGTDRGWSKRPELAMLGLIDMSEMTEEQLSKIVNGA